MVTSLLDLQTKLRTERQCHQFLAKQRWGDTVVCPHCACCGKIYKYANGIIYRCGDCDKQFTVRIGTIYENSKVSMRKWIIALYLFSSHKKGISSVQLSKDIGVTQKTAWYMLQRIRYMMGYQEFDKPLEGVIQSDESFVGGKNKNRHKDKKVEKARGRSFKDKTPVLGMYQKGGKLKAIAIKNTSAREITPLLVQHIKEGSTLLTDEWQGYRYAKWKGFDHHITDHSKGQYVTGEATTNAVENFWSHLKRGINGTYHKVSRKHLQMYCNEFMYRFNYRQMKDGERFMQTLGKSSERLRYKELIGEAA